MVTHDDAPRPAGANWGDYGIDDRLGRLNELTDDCVLRAAAEIRTGKRFCLSLPLDYPGGNVVNPNRYPPERSAVDRFGRPAEDFPLRLQREGARGLVNDDLVMLYTQYSTQWDAFGHIGAHFDADGDGNEEPRYYNAQYPAPDIAPFAVMGLQGRGVMVDLRRHFGDEEALVTHAMLEEVMREQNVVVEAGDILCLHTGYAQRLLDWGKQPDEKAAHEICAALDGADPVLQRWIAESGIAALVGDNKAVERSPAIWRETPSHALPLHELCLFKLGIPLGELWYLTELAGWLQAHGRTRFFLTGPPLRLPRAVGSPATPIGTV